MRNAWFSYLLLIALGASVAASTAPFDSSTSARPLDLPSGGWGRIEDEDAPEFITFYGAQFEGDGFFWCLDTSGSMSINFRLDVMKHEVSQAVRSLSAAAEFGLVAFNTIITPWSAFPRKAEPSAKSQALGWIAQLEASGWTCLTAAAILTLEICESSTKPNKAVIVVGDGRPFCDGVDSADHCLARVTAANGQGIPIHTLYTAEDQEGVAFMQELAARNHGTFTLAAP